MAAVSLWTATVWLVKKGKPFLFALIPSMFMTMVVTTYIIIAPEGFVRFFKNVPVHTIEFYGTLIASVVTIICTALLFNYKHHLHGKSHHAGHLNVAK